jgi:hypothetical protein
MWHTFAMMRNASGRWQALFAVVPRRLVRLLLYGIASLWGIAGSAGEAQATVLHGLSLEQLCERSPYILRGQVLRTRSLWQGGRIVTAVTLRVDRALAGDRRVGQQVTFYRLGGEVGGIGQRVIGAPRFRVGERVIVFLRANRGRLRINGMFQGKIRVLPAGGGTPARVVPPVSRTVLRGLRRSLRRSLPLAEFEARVRALVRARSGHGSGKRSGNRSGRRSGHRSQGKVRRGP